MKYLYGSSMNMIIFGCPGTCFYCSVIFHVFLFKKFSKIYIFQVITFQIIHLLKYIIDHQCYM